jgi:hypothetical protein
MSGNRRRFCTRAAGRRAERRLEARGRRGAALGGGDDLALGRGARVGAGAQLLERAVEARHGRARSVAPSAASAPSRSTCARAASSRARRRAPRRTRQASSLEVGAFASSASQRSRRAAAAASAAAAVAAPPDASRHPSVLEP